MKVYLNLSFHLICMAFKIFISGEADIGNYLFSASAVGSDALLQLDKKLEKKWTSASPSGRKPEINVSLQEMKKLERR